MWSGVGTVNGSRAALSREGTQTQQLTGNGAADLAPPRSNTGTVPDHAVLGSLVGFSHSVGLLVDLIIATLLCCREKQRGNGYALFMEEGQIIQIIQKEVLLH